MGGKQDVLVSGSNIKTINSSSIVGSGNLTVSLPQKSGIIAFSDFSGTPKKATVTFISPFSDTNYSVSIIGEDSRIWTIENKTILGFIINANASTDLTASVQWLAVKNGEV